MLLVELTLGVMVLWAVCYLAFRGLIKTLELIERAYDERSRW